MYETARPANAFGRALISRETGGGDMNVTPSSARRQERRVPLGAVDVLDRHVPGRRGEAARSDASWCRRRATRTSTACSSLRPPVEIRPVKGQIDDLLHEIRDRVKKGERVLVTTLTKRMAEDLAEYYAEVGVRCRYLHSEIETLERIKLLRDLRRGEFDVLIGINLLREGLDLPEVSLVAVLDADKEGFLRSSGSLIQTVGRCARHVHGRAILYADRMTDSMKRAIDETDRRRAIQRAYNEEHGIVPESIIRPLSMSLAGIAETDYVDLTQEADGIPEFKNQEELDAFIAKLESDMREAAKKFEFEKAAKLRDTVRELRTKEFLVT